MSMSYEGPPDSDKYADLAANEGVSGRTMGAVLDPLGEGPTGPTAVFEGRSLGQIAWARLKKDKVAMTCGVIIVILIVTALLSDVINHVLNLSPEKFYGDAVDADTGGLPLGNVGGISWGHPLGVEPGTGRDIFARLIYGMRISLTIALGATFLAVLFGTVFGAIAGFLGGFWDGAISRFMDLLLAFPLLLFLLSFTPIITQGLFPRIGLKEDNTGARVFYLIAIFGLFGWPYFGRIIRGTVLSLREREFVEASRALGASGSHIIFRQMLPNLWTQILVFASLTIPTYIGFEAALSFLGVGINPPTPTWGNMLADAVRYSKIDPAYFLIPGLALFLVVLVFNLFGDGLRDALDPKAGR